jgi:hypothetical protein
VPWSETAALLELGSLTALVVGANKRLYHWGDYTYSNFPNSYVAYYSRSPIQVSAGTNVDHTIDATYSLSAGDGVSFFVGNMTTFIPPPQAAPINTPSAQPTVAPPAAAPILAAVTCNGSPAPSLDPVWVCSDATWTLIPACLSGGCGLPSTITIVQGSTVTLAGENLSNQTFVVKGTLSITLNPTGSETQLGCLVLASLAASVTVALPSSVANQTEIFSYDKGCSNITVAELALRFTDSAPACKNFSLQETQDSPSRFSVSVLFSLPPECNAATVFNTGAVAGGIVGGLAVLAAAAVIAFLLFRRSRDRRTAALDEQEDEELAAVPSAAASASQGSKPPKSAKKGETEYSAITGKSESISNSLQYLEIIPAGSVKLVHMLGAGSFGKVHLGIYNTSFVAVKELLNPTVQQLEAFLEEARIHFQLPDHPFICKMYGVLIDVSAKQYAIVVEYCPNGSLFDSRKLINMNDEYSLFRVVFGVAKGMASLSAASIVHRDLAARNILLDERMYPKISDLGMSRKLDEGEKVGKTDANIGPIAYVIHRIMCSVSFVF